MRIIVTAAGLVLAVAICYAAEDGSPVDGHFLKIGHRGAGGYVAENTLGSFSRALELGVDMVELDVHLSRDGQLMVIHDESVDRTTDGSGLVAEMTLAGLQRLDAGGGEKIPTLGEVLELVGGRCAVNVELKGPGTAAPVAELLLEYVTSHGIQWQKILISSFEHPQLETIHKLEPRLRLAPLFHVDLPADFLAIARSLGAWSVNLNQESVTAALVERIHSAGLRVLVYTVDKPKNIARLKALGVDGIFSNYPDRLK